MLSREDRILSEILISRGLVAQERIEACTRLPAATTSGLSLAELLVDRGEIAPDEARRAAEEARSVEESLVPELEPGMRLGEFLLIRELGRGGMGIVFEAQQESLGRRVALKVLPAGGALDERLAIRFLRESRAAARLRHPGIVSVYTSGRAGSVLYFAMELIEGQTLAAAIAEAPLVAHEAARIAAEVARALDHAHAQGMVHRDVKPENILLSKSGRASGTAMIADFGLVQEASGGDCTRSRHILGTPAYISPEQARGEAVDARSDVYSLGAVLYAALSGSAPFSGAASSVVLARLLTERPPALATLCPDLPRPLVAICERAMAASPAERFGSAAELAEALELLPVAGEAIGAVSATPPPRTQRRPSLARAAAVTLAVAALTGLAAYIIAGRRHAPPVPGTPGIDGTAASAFRLVASAAGRKTTVSLSADGQRMAYASDVDGDWDIYLQVAAGGAPSNLTAGSPRVEFAPALSPDGRALAYVVAGKPSEIHVMDLLSGVSRLIVEHEASDLSWSPDGREILFTDSIYGGPRSGAAPTKLLAVDAATGRLRSLTGIYGAQASASSTGAVTFVGMGDGRMDIWMLPAGGGDAVRITDDMAAYWSPVWSRSGDAIYFGSDRLGGGALFRVAVDPLAGRALGEPVALSPAVFPGQFYLARGGDEDTALALLTTRHPGHLYRLSLAIDRPDAAPRVEPIPGRFLAARSPDVAPDGRSLAYTAVTSQEDLAVSAIDGTQARLLTQDAFRDRAPRWAPDGSRIAFHSDRSGQMEIWTITPDGSELTQHTRSVSAATRPSWSPDGRRLAYSVEGLGTFVIPVERDLAGGDAATAIGPLADGSGPFEAFAWSPDGDFLAGVARGIVIYAFGDGTFQRLTDHGTSPVWLDAQRILFSTQREIHLVDRRSGESMPLFALAPASIEPSLGIAPDGSSLYVGLSTSAEELWHVELKD